MHKQGAASPCRCHSAYRRTVMDERSGLVKIPYAFRWSSAPEHRFKIAIIRNRLHEGCGELPDQYLREMQAASIMRERVTLLSEFFLRDRRTFWIMRCLNNRPCSVNLPVTCC